MSGKNITIKTKDGGSFSGYLSTPPSGSGPGVLVLQEIFGVSAHIRSVVDRWAEEGYVALAPDLFWRLQPGVDLGFGPDDVKAARELGVRFDVDQGVRDMGDAIMALKAQPEFKGKAGAVGYCLGGRLAFLAAARLGVDAAVSYYGTRMDGHLDEVRSIRCPIVFHFGGIDAAVPPAMRDKIRAAFSANDDAEFYVYADAGHAFNNDRRAEAYHPFAAQLARSRSVGLFRRTLGPRYDLSALWDNHVDQEFRYRDPDVTMATMTSDAYVNHVPTLTGGYGFKELHRFYRNHFIARLPPDTKVVPVARTVGADRVVDELIFCFTHTCEIDFMAPGVAPTGKYVEVPTVVAVEFRGDKLYNEHIYWDQASMLAQMGVLEPKGLPIAGIESARKARGEPVPSNAMMPTWKNSAGGQ
ncbi:MAG: dienelactone hydrolase family protein [Candidatus Binatus sp.]